MYDEEKNSKRKKLIQEKDTKRENTIDNGLSMADSEGKARHENITISHQFDVYIKKEREMKKNVAYLYFADKGNAEDINLMDLPNEIIEKSLFPCLGYNELKILRSMNLRLKQIAESVIKNRCKYMKDISFYF